MVLLESQSYLVTDMPIDVEGLVEWPKGEVGERTIFGPNKMRGTSKNLIPATPPGRGSSLLGASVWTQKGRLKRVPKPPFTLSLMATKASRVDCVLMCMSGPPRKFDGNPT